MEGFNHRKTIPVLFVVGFLAWFFHLPSRLGPGDEPPRTEQECVALKGAWTTGGGPIREGAERFCVLPAKDAGAWCVSSLQCSQFCEARSLFAGAGEHVRGACAEFNLGGCRTRVEFGIARQSMCYD